MATADKQMNIDVKAREIASSCACFKLRKATRAITQLYDEVLEPCNIKVTQFTLLVALFLAGPAPVGILADELVMDRTTLTRNVALLIRDGLAEMVPGNDRRMKLLQLTTSGRALLTQAIPLWEEAQRSIVNRMGKNNWRDISLKLTAMTSLALLP